MKIKRTSNSSIQQPTVNDIHPGNPNALLPDFFNQKDATGVQEHLIRCDPSRRGEISHFVAVPMDLLSEYVHRRDIDESVYIWELRSMSCGRLRKICSLLSIKGAWSGNTIFCLNAILQQPGNLTFRWDRFKEAAYATRRPTVQPEVVLSAPETCTATPVTPTVPVPRKKARHSSEGERRSRKTVSPTTATTLHSVRNVPPIPEPTPGEDSTPPVVAPGFTSTLGPMSWETYARIIEQHRRSIEQKRNQEFAYYRELSSLAVNEGVRQCMLRTLDSIQESIHVEERALERLQAQYHDCIIKVITDAHSAGGSRVVPPARVGNYKTADLYDDSDE